MQEGKGTFVALQTGKGQIMCNYCALFYGVYIISQ